MEAVITTRFTPADLATEIEWARARLIDPVRYPLAAAQADRRTTAPPAMPLDLAVNLAREHCSTCSAP